MRMQKRRKKKNRLLRASVVEKKNINKFINRMKRMEKKIY